MVVRIWFTADDLARTRVAGPDPLAETVFSLIPLRIGAAPAGWLRRTRPRLTVPMRALAGMMPGRPMLDLVSVTGRTTCLEEGLEALLRAPRGVLDAEIDYFATAHGRVPAGLLTLLHTDRGVPRTLARALRTYHDVAVAPYWPRLRAHLGICRAQAGRLILDGGVDALLTHLRSPDLNWRPPVLEVRTGLAEPAPDRDYHLGGRGLLLAPSVFFGPHPVYFRDLTGQGSDMLVYPARPDPVGTARFWTSADEPDLAALLGPTRAAVLSAAATGATTTELAERAGTSVPSASEHATVLRNAGLLRSERRGGPAVHHHLTDLGVQFLEQHR